MIDSESGEVLDGDGELLGSGGPGAASVEVGVDSAHASAARVVYVEIARDRHEDRGAPVFGEQEEQDGVGAA